MVTVDNSDFARAAQELAAGVAAIDRGVRQVVSKGALNIKQDMQARVRESTHFSGRGVAESINYDLRDGNGFSEAEIGPAKGGPGDLMNVAYFGTSRGGGSVEDPVEAMNREAPRFDKALADLMAKAFG